MRIDEDRIILSLLEDEPLPVAAGADEEALVRAYTEVWGLLPYELDPVVPRPELKQRLLAAVEQEGPGPGADDEAPRLRGPAAVPAPRRAWALPLAAGLALALVGLASWSFGRLGQAERIAGLESQLEAALAERGGLAADLATYRLMTAAGVEICPLLPTGEAPPRPAARGMLYVAPDRQQWHLRLVGLGEPPPGQIFRVWFVTDRGPVAAETVRPGAGEVTEVGSATMPSAVRAVMVTQEREGAPGPGPTLLYGDEAMVL